MASGAPSSDGVRRVADLQLRGPVGPLRVYACWPVSVEITAPPALVLVAPEAGAEALSRRLCAQLAAVVLGLPIGPDEPLELSRARAGAVTEWVADHGAELDADAKELVVAGAGRGTAVALAVTLQAIELGWPPIRLLAFVDPADG